MSRLSDLVNNLSGSYLPQFGRAAGSFTLGADVTVVDTTGTPGPGILGSIIVGNVDQLGAANSGQTLRITVDGVLATFLLTTSGVGNFATTGPFLAMAERINASNTIALMGEWVCDIPFRTSLQIVLRNTDAGAKTTAPYCVAAWSKKQ